MESESKRSAEKERSMNDTSLKRMLAAMVFAIFAAPLVAATADAGSSLRIHPTVADNAITALEWTCDPSTGLPYVGDAACIGIETTTGTFSGDIEGTYLAEIDFAVLADGEAPFTSFETITGTVAGHGSGSFTVLEVDTISPSGELTGRWRVIERSGTGDLVGITGKGKVAGTYDATTGLASGQFTGVLHFSK
jgi:hypothetical protein